MLPGLLSIAILLLALFIFGFVVLYGFYKSAKNKFYRKLKISASNWGMFILLIIIFLLIAILLLISYLFEGNSFVCKNFYIIPISWILFVMSDILLILIILINKKINSTRLEIVNFRNENFQIKLNPLQKYNYENLIKQKYQRYFSILEQKQKIIETMIDKFDANNYQSILTEIIMFNETMVSRWNDKINNTQLKIFFQMCIKLQNLIKTKKL